MFVLIGLMGILAGTAASGIKTLPSSNQAPTPSGTLGPIVGGTKDPAHPEVGALVSRRHQCRPDQVGYVCTVTLLSPRVAITAAHCLDIYGPEGPYEVLFTDDVDNTDPLAALVLQTLVHPDYDPQRHDMDLALLVLDRNVTLTPAEPMDRLLDATDVGSTVTAVGFGLTGPDDLGTYGIKRRGDMLITQVDLGSFETEPGPAMTCSGDSGGPVFLTTDQVEHLVGVTASGDQACRSYAHNIQVAAAWDDFIQPVLDQVASEPLPTEEGTLRLDELCTEPCQSDDDCPAHLRCLPGLGGTNKCVLPGLIPGQFAGSCSTNQDCPSGTCARLHPSGPDSCLCMIPCDQMEPPDGGLGDGTLSRDGAVQDGAVRDDAVSDAVVLPDGGDLPGPGRGCACNAAPPGNQPPWWWILLGAIYAMGRRRRSFS